MHDNVKNKGKNKNFMVLWCLLHYKSLKQCLLILLDMDNKAQIVLKSKIFIFLFQFLILTLITFSGDILDNSSISTPPCFENIAITLFFVLFIIKAK